MPGRSMWTTRRNRRRPVTTWIGAVARVGVFFCVAGTMMLPAGGETLERLRKGFADPPQKAAAQTWYHWAGDFVTKRGITADLEAMKEIGYGAAHIFTVTKTPPTPGRWPQVMSTQWRELFRHAAAECGRLGLALGVHNCPGWSSSGGPWIRPEDSMKRLVSTFQQIAGPAEGPFRLEQPVIRHGFYHDVAVLAFPGGAWMPEPEISADFPLDEGGALVDGKLATAVAVPLRQRAGDAGEITYRFAAPFRARAVEILFGEEAPLPEVRISVSDDGKRFRPAGSLRRAGKSGIADPEYLNFGTGGVKARFFRFSFRNPVSGAEARTVRVAGIRLLNTLMISGIADRNSSRQRFRYVPPEAGEAGMRGVAPAAVLDLTKYLKPDGSLEWRAPEGDWILLRIGYTTTGATNKPIDFRGLECDKLSRRGLDAHWPQMMAELIADARPYGSLRYATIDSYEVGGQNWTEGFAGEFTRRRGYDLMPWLPVTQGFVVGSVADSARFLYDFQRTVADLFAENYYDYFAELCRRNGLTAIVEPYDGPFDQLRCGRNAEIVAGEFWINWTPVDRVSSSSAHFFGKSRVGAEAFTAHADTGRYLQDPRQLKEHGDRAWADGISLLIMHSFVHQPLLNVRPGFSLDRYGSHLNRNNTWWSQGRPWVEYINRSQFLLQSGESVGDLLILAGEGRPNHSPQLPALSDAGYSADYCGSDDLREFTGVEGGRIIVPSGVSYAALSLGGDRHLSLATLKKAAALLEAGATVAGVPPEHSPSLGDDDREYAMLREKLWGEQPSPDTVRRVGRGRLIVSADPVRIMELAGVVPDFAAAPGIRFLHRREKEVELYFIYNSSDFHYSGEMTFRAGRGKAPQLWLPDSGRIVSIPVCREMDHGRCRLPLALGPQESCFVIFAPGGRPPAESFVVEENGTPPVEIEKAIYRGRGGGGSSDVTAVLKGRVTPEGLSLTVQNADLGGDPAPGRYKELFLAYRFRGERHEAVIREKNSFSLRPDMGPREPAAVPVALDGGGLAVEFHRPGTVRITGSGGGVRRIAVGSVPEPVRITGPWTLEFPPDLGAPARVELPELISWSEQMCFTKFGTITIDSAINITCIF